VTSFLLLASFPAILAIWPADSASTAPTGPGRPCSTARHRKFRMSDRDVVWQIPLCMSIPRSANVSDWPARAAPGSSLQPPCRSSACRVAGLYGPRDRLLIGVSRPVAVGVQAAVIWSRWPLIVMALSLLWCPVCSSLAGFFDVVGRTGVAFLEWTPDGPLPYNPYAHGSDTEIADKALAGELVTEPHYLRQAQRYLGHAVRTYHRPILSSDQASKIPGAVQTSLDTALSGGLHTTL
jgi:hypothetical protein